MAMALIQWPMRTHPGWMVATSRTGMASLAVVWIVIGFDAFARLA
jgi:hypothetical protein